jgi:hypothetical protein
MPTLILAALGGSISWLIFLFKPLGEIGLIELMTKAPIETFYTLAFSSKLTLGAKIFASTVGAIQVSFWVYILFHFHSLLECFFDGEIFNCKALTHARKAFKMNLICIYFEIGFQLLAVAFAIYVSEKDIEIRFTHFFGNILSNLVLIGFLSLILWALEIGTDLNEEAELTI